MITMGATWPTIIVRLRGIRVSAGLLRGFKGP